LARFGIAIEFHKSIPKFGYATTRLRMAFAACCVQRTPPR
jgi:hypothetical protein